MGLKGGRLKGGGFKKGGLQKGLGIKKGGASKSLFLKCSYPSIGNHLRTQRENAARKI
jgi:hypothetical protein